MDQRLIDELDALLRFAEIATSEFQGKIIELQSQYNPNDKDWQERLRQIAATVASLLAQPVP